jgi:ADP-ribose pyrophosphatase YjhB (NUDIX family)
MEIKKQAVQIVLLNEVGEVLAVSRKDNHKDFGLVGGKVDPEDATPEDAAIRETKEETGLDITNLRLIYATHKNGRMGYTYLADYTGEIHTDEPHVVKWTPFETIIKGTFGYWNKCVSESLTDMGVEFKMKSEAMSALETVYNYGTGMSSDSIMAAELGLDKYSERPYDFGDLMRCIGIVKAFDIDIEIMRHKSEAWNMIVDNWDMLLVKCDRQDKKEINEFLEKLK